MVGLVSVITLFVHRDLRAVPRAVPVPRSRTSRRSSPTAAGRCRRSARGHILGTDQIGRDLLSRLLDGARISMTVAIVVQIVVLTIGVPIGALAGWFGGRMDNLLMRFTDVMYAFPDLLFIILLSVVVPRDRRSARRWTACCWSSSPSA